MYGLVLFLVISVISVIGSVKLSGKKRSRRGTGKLVTRDEEEMTYNWLIKNVGDGNDISRYILEGVLLYTLNIPNLKVYNVIMNLSNRNILELFTKSDGEYYLFNEKRS